MYVYEGNGGKNILSVLVRTSARVFQQYGMREGWQIALLNTVQIKQ